MPHDEAVPGNIFIPSFLRDLETTPVGQSSEATEEAEFAGPWRIEPLRQGWAVIAEGETVPELVTPSHDLALQVAALLPGSGRAPYVRLLDAHEEQGFPLVGRDGAVLGHLRHFRPELAQVLHAVECLRREPLNLAHVLASLCGLALQRAGQILWSWRRCSYP